MNGINLIIPDIEFNKDFTIIYKGTEERIYEIKTSKQELLQKLRFFKNKQHEIEKLEEIVIREQIKYDYFNDFINSIHTKQLIITDDNYLVYYQLSSKYGYYELEKEIKKFIEERPDLQITISQIIHQSEFQQKAKGNENNYETIDNIKEELISKNLDFCLKHEILNHIPLINLI